MDSIYPHAMYVPSNAIEVIEIILYNIFQIEVLVFLDKFLLPCIIEIVYNSE